MARQTIEQRELDKLQNSFMASSGTNPDIDTNLDPTTYLNSQLLKTTLLGTRINLLEDLINALELETTNHAFTSDDVPVNLPLNRPSLLKHAQQWSLNAKQEKSFILCGATILKRIFDTNENPELQLDQNVEAMNTDIKARPDRILPPTEQLVLYLGGCGGTGKSQVIQAVVDFARRWNVENTVVISAISGVAAVNIGGCTLHSALGTNGVNTRFLDPARGIINIDIYIFFRRYFLFLFPITETETPPPTGTVTVVPNNNAREQGTRHREWNFLKTLPPITTGDLDWRKRSVILIQAAI